MDQTNERPVADRVHAAAEALNRVVEEAAALGCRVDIRLVRLAATEAREACPSLSAVVHCPPDAG